MNAAPSLPTVRRPHGRLLQRAHPATAAVRSGATLTEVLMSLLIMSVGILSVMSLYPIALLRTIRAAQVTNATILSENAVEDLLAGVELVDGVPVWQPAQRYVVGDIVRPQPRFGAAADTNRMFQLIGGNDPDGLAGPLVSGVREPD